MFKFATEVKYIYLNYENNPLWSFFTFFVMVHWAGAGETGLYIGSDYFTEIF